MARELTPQDKHNVDAMISRARLAMEAIEDYSQAQLDQLAQAIGWYTSNEKTFTHLAQLGVDESGIGDRAG
ncbi:MAG: hypothetical protein ACPH5N_03635, partial [Pseudomonadales bacterium]